MILVYNSCILFKENMTIRIALLIFLLSFYCVLNSQERKAKTWWNPSASSYNVIEGRAWKDAEGFNYNRLPNIAKGSVRDPVWQLSKHSAGLSINFTSNSPNISIRYKVKGAHAMPHMPSTGVSGVDLYAKNNDGEWLWNRGNYKFSDTITYTFNDLYIKESHHNKGRDYKLYLPLYNEVEWLEIGTEKKSIFIPNQIRKEKPIVVYGTSIAQGACASRPGMAWTSILERKLDSPVINLGFSGNGRLEDEVLNVIAEIDAEVFVIDCLPNLTQYTKENPQFVHDRIIASVKKLREKHPSTPVLLVEHSGYSDGTTNKERYDYYSGLNTILQKAFHELQAEGVNDVFTLTKEELNLGIDSYVDGTHPNDLGMLQQASAYEKSIGKILNRPKGSISTTIPVTQNRDGNVYNWSLRHQNILETNQNEPPKICFIGNSIVHQWGGVPNMRIANGTKSWATHFEKLGVRNFGYGWDRIENVLWRIYHGELDGFDAEQIILKIGTNNLHLNTDDEIIDGLKFLMEAVKYRQPKAKVILIGILPRRNQETRIKRLNTLLEKASKTLQINYLSIGNALLGKDEMINESLFRDGLHPNEKGYEKLAPQIKTYLLK